MIKAAIVYWIVLNFLVVVGGVVGWFQLKRSEQRVSHYLSRVLMADALRGALSLWGTGRFRTGLVISPLAMLCSVVVITLLTGAIWGWLLYTHGFINGGGWWGLFRRRRKTSDEPHVSNDRF